MKENGSPRPEFDTDDDRISFLIRLPVHEKARQEVSPEITPQVTPQVAPQVTGQVGTESALSEHQVRLESRLESHLAARFVLGGRSGGEFPGYGVRLLEHLSVDLSKKLGGGQAFTGKQNYRYLSFARRMVTREEKKIGKG